MGIAERIFVALGAVSLLFSGYLFLLMRDHEYGGGWFSGLDYGLFRLGSAIFAVIGLCLLLYGLYLLRRAHVMQMFDEALKAANAPRKDA
jgi:hypothetical protein